MIIFTGIYGVGQLNLVIGSLVSDVVSWKFDLSWILVIFWWISKETIIKGRFWGYFGCCFKILVFNREIGGRGGFGCCFLDRWVWFLVKFLPKIRTGGIFSTLNLSPYLSFFSPFLYYSTLFTLSLSVSSFSSHSPYFLLYSSLYFSTIFLFLHLSILYFICISPLLYMSVW